MSLNESLNKLKNMAKPDLAQVVDFIIEEAGVLTQSKLAYFAVMNRKEDVLTMIGWSKTVMDACSVIDKPIVYPIEKTGLWGDCVRERKPVVTNDYKACQKPTKKGYPSGHVDVVRHMNLCMMDAQRIAGVIGVGNKDSDYTDADVQLLQEFANACFSYLPAEEVEGIIS